MKLFGLTEVIYVLTRFASLRLTNLQVRPPSRTGVNLPIVVTVTTPISKASNSDVTFSYDRAPFLSSAENLI